MPPTNQVETPMRQDQPFLTSELAAAPEGTTTSSASALEAEDTLWEGSCSLKNFVGRAVMAGVMTAGWIALAIATWVFGYTNMRVLTYVVGLVVLTFWLAIGIKIVRTVRSHHYRLTTRRLFVRTGFFHRRVDQVELVRVKDLYVRQNVVEQWLDVGNVILITSEETLPKALLLGIEKPHEVMDLIWRNTRLERDRRTTEVNQSV